MIRTPHGYSAGSSNRPFAIGGAEKRASLRSTVVSSGAAGVSVLLPGPTSRAESGPAPRHPRDLEVEAHEPTRGPEPV